MQAHDWKDGQLLIVNIAPSFFYPNFLLKKINCNKTMCECVCVCVYIIIIIRVLGCVSETCLKKPTYVATSSGIKDEIPYAELVRNAKLVL